MNHALMVLTPLCDTFWEASQEHSQVASESCWRSGDDGLAVNADQNQSKMKYFWPKIHFHESRAGIVWTWKWLIYDIIIAELAISKSLKSSF
jgi:hypothetical protein